MTRDAVTTGLAVTCLVVSGQFLATSALAQAQAPEATQSTDADSLVLTEVVVTAQRRSELQREVPIAITSISADQLTQSGANNLADIGRVTPALRFDYVGAFAQPTIRGIGTSVATPGGGANVGIYVDGFYSPNPAAANFELLNVENVQVLKGPQGTLFGRNTTGGAILVSTAEPSFTPSAIVEASYGSYDAQRYQAYATTGLTDNIAIDVQGMYRQGDGFIRNIDTGDDNPGAYENWSGRIGLRADLSDRVSLLFRYSHDSVDDPTQAATSAYESGGVVYSTGAVMPQAIVATRPGQVSTDARTLIRTKSDSFQLTGTIEFDFATLTSYSQYREDKTENYLDLDHSSAPIYAISVPVSDETITQEFLLTSNADSSLQWTAGLFYFDYQDAYPSTDASAGGGPYMPFAHSSVDTRSMAAFFDATWEVKTNWFVTAGLRYSHDELMNAFFQNEPGPVTPVPSVENDEVSPRVVVRYKPTEQSSIYASYTRGYKPAILNVGGGSLDGVNVAPEKISAYEVGYKFGAAGASVDLSSFYYDYENLQVTSYTGMSSLITNAATSRIYGLEGQFRYEFDNGLEFTSGMAYLDADYDKFTTSPVYTQCLDPACGPGFGMFLISNGDASGNRMLRAPEFTGNIGLRYATPLSIGQLVLSGNLYATSKVYFDSSNRYSQDGYELLNLRAEWTDPSNTYTVAVYGDNVTDSEYRTQAEGGPFGISSVWGYPATVGVSVRARF